MNCIRCGVDTHMTHLRFIKVDLTKNWFSSAFRCVSRSRNNHMVDRYWLDFSATWHIPALRYTGACQVIRDLLEVMKFHCLQRLDQPHDVRASAFFTENRYISNDYKPPRTTSRAQTKFWRYIDFTEIIPVRPRQNGQLLHTKLCISSACV